MAKEESSSSASIAPCVAMMALTPQTAEPTARSVVSFGRRLKTRPRKSHEGDGTGDFHGDQPKLTPPRFRTSPRRNRAPRRTIPAFSQNS